MDYKCKLKTSVIPEVFESMEYGKNDLNLDKVKVWLKTKENSIFAYVEKSSENPNGVSTTLLNTIDSEPLCTIFVPEIDITKTILSKCGDRDNWLKTTPLEKATKLNKLAGEIEKNADLFAQIEAVTKGIPAKLTKTVQVPYLAQWFNYYSGFSIKHNLENSAWKPEGIAAGVIANENPLSNLGLFLGPALAAGYNVVLQVGTKLSLAAFLILELAVKVGIPEDALRLIPSDDGELLPYLSSDNVSILTLFVDLRNEKYRGINSSNKKILHLSSYKTPVIVFEGADLDSAVNGIIEAAWSYKSAWPANTVLIQENILPEVLRKLKAKMQCAKVGSALDEMVDITYRDEQSLKILRKTITLAKSQGIEVFQAVDDENKWCPTLLIGGKVPQNTVLSSGEEYGDSSLTALAFRSVDEAVNLANNTRQGVGASVWSENIGIVNEVSRKLKVSNVWVNSTYGMTTVDVAFTPLKESGSGYFGGSEGFYEYVQIWKIPSATATFDKDIPLKLNTSVIGKVNVAKKAQESWNKLGHVGRGKILQQLAERIDDIPITNAIYQFTVGSSGQSYVSTQNGYSIVSFREARGVIAMEKTSAQLLILALYHGNAIIALDDKPSDISKELSLKLPAGVFTILPNTLEITKAIASHNGINCAIDFSSSIVGILPLKDSTIFTQTSSDFNDINRKVTVAKNIWCDIGKSSTCNL